ncbi:DUF3352 domain-containing protein [Nostocoides veronense]|uniref:DUF3352 domain-containing protein n=1 Tax=Nostocoides veronense TaxID=330836 RepID=A0ABN2M3Y9_9MICO
MTEDIQNPAEPLDGVVEVAAPKRRRGVTIAAVGGTLALVGLAAGGALAMNALSGGGPQPEDVLPANTLGFAKIDLDPSSGQKISALRLMRKFPALKDQLSGTDDNSDLRRVVFEAAQKEGGLKGLSYDADVAPWIGDRFAMAAVPTADGKGVVPVMLLASTDQAKAKAALAKAATDGAACDVLPDFVRCTEKAEELAALASAPGTKLVDSAGFKGDMKDLGEDGIVSMWLDLGAAVDLAATESSVSAQELDAVKDKIGGGRMYAALRFDGANVEVAGAVRDAKAPAVDASGSTEIGSLPADTIAAVSFNSLGEQVKSAWADVQKALDATSGESDLTGSIQNQFGISLPDDLVGLLGKHTTFTFGGMGSDDMPKIALKTDGDPAVAQKLVNAVSDQGQPLGLVGDGRVVLALDQTYADAVAKGSGLDKNEAFVNAMPDYKNASQAVFVNIAKVIEAFGADIPADMRANLDPLSAFGMTGTQKGGDSDFTIRLTTR